MPQDNAWNPAREHYESLDKQFADKSNTFAAYNSIFDEVDFPWIDGLKYRVNLGLDYRTTKGGYYKGLYSNEYSQYLSTYVSANQIPAVFFLRTTNKLLCLIETFVL